MVIAAAAEAFIDLVEPNWVISRTTSLASMAFSLSPGPSCPNRNTHCSGSLYSSIFWQPGTLSMAMIGRFSDLAQVRNSSTVSWCLMCW